MQGDICRYVLDVFDVFRGMQNVQATVGSDGRVLLFDSKLFMGGAGGVISPAAAQQICSPGCTIAGLEWLSGGQSILM